MFDPSAFIGRAALDLMDERDQQLLGEALQWLTAHTDEAAAPEVSEAVWRLAAREPLVGMTVAAFDMLHDEFARALDRLRADPIRSDPGDDGQALLAMEAECLSELERFEEAERVYASMKPEAAIACAPQRAAVLWLLKRYREVVAVTSSVLDRVPEPQCLMLRAKSRVLVGEPLEGVINDVNLAVATLSAEPEPDHSLLEEALALQAQVAERVATLAVEKRVGQALPKGDSLFGRIKRFFAGE